eukprot:gene1791-1086_t
MTYALTDKQQRQHRNSLKINNNNNNNKKKHEEKQTTTQGDVNNQLFNTKKGNPTFDFARGGATNWIFTRTQAPTPELDRGPPQLCAMPHSLKRLYIFRFVPEERRQNNSKYARVRCQYINKQQQHAATPNGSAETYRPIQLEIQFTNLIPPHPQFILLAYIYTGIYIYIYQHTQKERDVPTLPDSHKNSAISKTQY